MKNADNVSFDVIGIFRFSLITFHLKEDPSV